MHIEKPMRDCRTKTAGGEFFQVMKTNAKPTIQTTQVFMIQQQF